MTEIKKNWEKSEKREIGQHKRNGCSEAGIIHVSVVKKNKTEVESQEKF